MAIHSKVGPIVSNGTLLFLTGPEVVVSTNLIYTIFKFRALITTLSCIDRFLLNCLRFDTDLYKLFLTRFVLVQARAK